MMPFHHCIILNFEKNDLLLAKDFFSGSFQSCKFFHEIVSCVKMEPKGNLIKSSIFLKYDLT